MTQECSQCGQEFVGPRALQAHDCPEDMTDSDRSDLSDDAKERLARRSGVPPENGGYVPIGVLEELIQDRMEKAELWRDKGLNADYHATKEFAEELRETIADYGDTDE